MLDEDTVRLSSACWGILAATTLAQFVSTF